MGLFRLLHRSALFAYPRAFRHEFGPELERVFSDRLSAARERGRWRMAGLAVFQTADALLSGLAERARAIAVWWAWPRQASTTSPVRKGTMSWQSLSADIRLALRQFRRAPLFAALTVASLALGIGANSAIFGVLHAVLLRPLPYAAPDRLVSVWSDNSKQSEPNNPVSPANFEAFRQAPALDVVEAMYSFLVPARVRIGTEPEVVQAATLTPGMFKLLGREALIGRAFQPGDPDGQMVISYRYWQRRFGADSGVVGRTVTVSGYAAPVTILGVMPDDFLFPYRSMLGPSGFVQSEHADVWLQLYGNRDGRYLDAAGQPNRNIHYLSLVARLASGATIETARAQLAAIATKREAEFTDTNGGWRITARPLHEQAVGSMRPALVTLAAGVGIVLLITCINIANVLLARATGRQRDLAIRSALGASGGRLIQQALVDSLLLAIAGGALGVGLMIVGVQAILAVAPATLTRIAEVSPSLTVALFAGVVSILTGLAVGAVPALSAARTNAQDALRETHRATASPVRRRLRAGLIVAEVAMAMALTVGAGLLLRSFVAVLGVQPGFRPDNLLTLQMSVPGRVQPGPARLAFYDDLEARIKSLPGVTHVGGTTRLPLGSTNVSTYVEVEGRGTPRAEWPEVELRRAVFDFFGAMNIPLVEGRTFTADDGPAAPLVLVVNTAFASRIFPGESALGRRVRFGGSQDGPWSTIVGVVGSVKHASLEETPKPELYIWYRQGPPVSPFLAIRTSGDPSAMATSVREVIRAAGADPPTEVRTMAEIRSASLGQRRFVLLLVGLFGVLALTLAVVGVYGVITLVATERTTEVGIRLALGSTPTQVLQLVVGHALKLALIGIAVGAGLALAVSPALASQLFGVGGADPMTYIGVALALVLISTLAALMPARRAMRIDPAATLRT